MWQGWPRRLLAFGISLVLIVIAVTSISCHVEPIPVPEPEVVEPEPDLEPEPYKPPHELPGPAAERVFFRAFDVDRAPRHLQAGDMDLYMFSLKTAAAEALRDDPGIELYEAPATMLSLILNPAPAPEGELNPFSIPGVRQAVQYLVDREVIARDIFRGMALPMITHVSPNDFDYLTVYDLDRGSGISYDPEFGRQLLTEAMEAEGARRIDGIWHYGDEPIRLRLVGRVEDERRDIVDLVRVELEKAGFQVVTNYRSFAPAVLTVYSTDPQTLEWHLYTEGWGRGAPVRYDFATVNSMNAPWLGNMPGWQEVGFWQYEHEELDLLGKRLFRGEISSHEERNQLYRRMTELGLEESVRIWLVTAVNTFPAQEYLAGVSRDPVAGPRAPWTLREAYVAGEDGLTIGHLWVWTERTTWNPIGGFGDVYSVDIWRNVHDPPLWNHPFTGIPQALRVGFEVETAGPEDRLRVPSGSVMWNAEADEWQRVDPGTRAISRVTFDYSKYFSSVWHHGEPITMADVLYSIAQSYELAYDPNKARVEVAIAVTQRPYLETFRGYRVLDDERLEVYVDFWHFDESHIASYASPASLNMPWELLAAMDHLVFEERRAAYSDTAAMRFGVPWISLVLREDAGLVQRALRRLGDEAFVPKNVFTIGTDTLIGPDDARKRYEAARAWYEDFGHLVISNGPFYLVSYDPPAQFAELRAFRDEAYPFRPGDWFFGDPPELAFVEVAVPTVSPGQPAEVRVTLQGPGNLGLRYLLLDPSTGKVLTIDEADLVSPEGNFVVTLEGDLTSGLKPGFYRLFLAAYSDVLAFISEHHVSIDVFP